MTESPKCLLVDDLDENLIALRGLLKGVDAEIITAKSGVEALELMLKHDFAVALLDVQMPEMDGFELAEIMRGTERTKHIPIIFVTAGGADSHRLFKGYDSGAVDFLTKPLMNKAVISKVKVFLELYRHKADLQEKILSLKKTEEELQKAVAMRDEFLSICSHELNTPLTALQMQIQIIEKREQRIGPEAAYAPETMKKFVNSSFKSVKRLIMLVSDMLDIARVNSGRLSLTLVETELNALIKDFNDTFSPQMKDAGCVVSVEYYPEEINLPLDPFRIEQVLTNLYSNIIKYAPGEPVSVKVGRDQNFAWFSVKDNGKGISKDQQFRIFDRFERIESPDLISGLGLGLYICKEIMTLHHGSISLESTPGDGAKFLVKIPLT